MATMHPRPFCRSLLFWLGLPGLVFLLWVWWDSGRWFTQVYWSGKSSYLGEISTGRLSMTAHTEIGAPQPHIDGFSWKRSPEVPNPGSGSKRAPQWDIPGGLEYSKRDLKYGPAETPTYRVTTVRIAWWLLTLGYLIGWLAALVALAGWQRHKSRLLKLHTAP